MTFPRIPHASIRGLGASVLAVCLFPGWSAAQQPPDTTARPLAPRATALSEMVVTATRTTQRIGEVPANITVLTRRDFGTSMTQTVPGVLSRIPGFAARDYQNPLTASAARSAPSFRGLGSSIAGRTLVLFDGVPLNEPFSGIVHWARVPLALVDRVEAVRGGGSMVWGSRALGGVINVLSRVPGPSRVDVELEGGDRSTFRGAGDITGRRGPVSVTLAGSLGESDGFRTIRPDLAGPIDVAMRTSNHMVLGKVAVDLTSAVRAYVAGNYLKEWHQGPTPTDSGPATMGEVRGGVRVVTRRAGVLEFTGYGNHRTGLSIATNVAADRTAEVVRSYSRSPSDGVGVSALWSQTAGPHTLSAGTDWSVAKGAITEDYGLSQGVMTRQRVSEGRQVLGGIFLQDGWELAPSWRLLGALRFDVVRDEHGRRRERDLSSGDVLLDTAYAAHEGTRLSFNAGVRREVTSWLTARASVYQAFRAATLNERYRPNRGTGRGNITESNSELKPEHLTGAEIGADLTLHQGLLVRLGGFWNRVLDPVVDVTVGVASQNGEVIDPCGALLKDQVCRQRRNVGSLRTVGLETEIEYHPAADWSLWGSYTYNPTRIAAPGQPIDGKASRGSARHVATAFVTWDHPRLLGVTLEGRYVGTRFDDDLNSLELGDFTVVGLRLNRRLSRQSSAYLKVENLFDTQFEVTRSTTGIVEIGGPRWVLAGVRASW